RRLRTLPLAFTGNYNIAAFQFFRRGSPGPLLPPHLLPCGLDLGVHGSPQRVHQVGPPIPSSVGFRRFGKLSCAYSHGACTLPGRRHTRRFPACLFLHTDEPSGSRTGPDGIRFDSWQLEKIESKLFCERLEVDRRVITHFRMRCTMFLTLVPYE
ncbi:indoleacetamide hydrolase, partial [Striga asiatica]